MSARQRGQVPVLPLASADPVLRGAAAGSMLLDLPDAVVVQHDLDVPAGVLHRVVHDRDGVVEDHTLPMAHACLSCAVREDVLPALRRLARTGRWEQVVLALPVAAEPLPVVRGLRQAFRSSARRLLTSTPEPVIAPTVTVLDSSDLAGDLLGDDLLVDRGVAFGEGDRRSVGEVLAHQVEFSDALLLTAPPDARGGALLDHLVAPSAARGVLGGLDPESLLARPASDGERLDPRQVEPTGAPDEQGVWTLDLTSWRPLHPDRLMEALEELGGGPVRGRGRFWLPTRPGRLCVWDGGGGQLSVGDGGPWGSFEHSTRLVVTGVDGDPAARGALFERVLLTDRELAEGPERWAEREDDFGPWLDESAAA